jgi:hypothetical protein
MKTVQDIGLSKGVVDPPRRYQRRCSVTEQTLQTALQISAARILAVAHVDDVLSSFPSVIDDKAWGTATDIGSKTNSELEKDRSRLQPPAWKHDPTSLSDIKETANFLEAGVNLLEVGAVPLASLQLVHPAECCRKCICPEKTLKLVISGVNNPEDSNGKRKQIISVRSQHATSKRRRV